MCSDGDEGVSLAKIPDVAEVVWNFSQTIGEILQSTFLSLKAWLRVPVLVVIIIVKSFDDGPVHSGIHENGDDGTFGDSWKEESEVI